MSESIEAAIAFGPDTLTPDALRALVGQRPAITLNRDWSQPLGRAEVVAADQRDGDLHLTLSVSERVRERVNEAFDILGDVSVEERRYGCGFVADKITRHGPKHANRLLHDMRLMEVGPDLAAPPATPKES